MILNVSIIAIINYYYIKYIKNAHLHIKCSEALNKLFNKQFDKL